MKLANTGSAQLQSKLVKGLAPAVAIAVMMIAQPAWSQQDAADPAIKRSSSGICHDETSRHFSRVKNFTPYTSMQACLDDGGRAPKK
jgi:hypothetical protein